MPLIIKGESNKRIKEKVEKILKDVKLFKQFLFESKYNYAWNN